MAKSIVRPSPHSLRDETPEARLKRAKRRMIDRLARTSLEQLRRSYRSANVLTWNEKIDLFLLRGKLRGPAKGTLARRFMLMGLRLGRFLDRALEVVQPKRKTGPATPLPTKDRKTALSPRNTGRRLVA